MKRLNNNHSASNRSNQQTSECNRTNYMKFCQTLRQKKHPKEKFQEVSVHRVIWSKEESKLVVSQKPTIIKKSVSVQKEKQYSELNYTPISEFIVPRQISQMHKKISFALLPKLNEYLKTSFFSLRLDSILGQYVHTDMFLYYLTANNSKKITACISCSGKDEQYEPFYLNIAKIGHINGLQIQKQLIIMDNWPSCGAYHQQSPSQMCDRDIVSEYIDQINEKVGISAERWEIIRVWTQIVCGTNYMFHLESENGEKASIGIYVSFSGCGGYGAQNDDELKEEDGQEEELSTQIWGFAKGHVRMDQLQSNQIQ